MALENIDVEHGNFTVRFDAATFFTMDHEAGTLIEKATNEFGPYVVFTYVLETTIFEVQSLQFDGVYFWSLERQGTSGFRVRRWDIDAANIVCLLDEFSYATDVINKYDVNAMAVESYVDSLDEQVSPGTLTFDVVDGATVRIGDKLVIGPSTAVGFEGEYCSTTVINKVGDFAVTVAPAVDKLFYAGNELHFTRSFFVFSDTAPGNQPGALYRFLDIDGSFLSLNVSNMFNGVGAATFFSGKLLFVRAGEIIWLSADSLNIYKSQAIDNLDALRGEYHPVFDLTGYSDTIYRLEQQKVYFSEGLDRYTTENWSPLFNYNESPTAPEIYFIAVKADPPLLPRYVSGIEPTDIESEITVTVLDQFRTPVSTQVIDLSSDGGPLSSYQETTDANGQVRATYTADSTLGNVTITAEIPEP